MTCRYSSTSAGDVSSVTMRDCRARALPVNSGLVVHSMGGAVIEYKLAKGFAVMFGSSDRMIGFSCALKKGLPAALFSGTATTRRPRKHSVYHPHLPEDFLVFPAVQIAAGFIYSSEIMLGDIFPDSVALSTGNNQYRASPSHEIDSTRHMNVRASSGFMISVSASATTACEAISGAKSDSISRMAATCSRT
ncbi:hypothetical protein M404DRAFT_935232 [Pisolithus tinctorius Marx 270]|uniref:Uncharacterized protein n=1 Tax=Pisolithus tinctorius Marx 270 TaxID=870435 RepID=A0A0C3PLV3_PISTI|nr:hypothetical protein M404DRAFT_935232 [Pisolithus tinctorius Marx 270]